ncbi:MAG: chloride channel protein [Bacteroides sp. SM23_62_1]|nr:MAG: chloride channel protein [Bacteroides sp. SM23_62_1]
MKRIKVYQRFLIWRLKNIGQRQFIMLLSALIGLGVGLAAVIIKNLVHFIQLLLTNELYKPYNYLYFITPVIGILITVLFIKYINKRPVGHGIPSVLYAISKNNGVIRRHNLYSSVITSAITVGFGGSVGLEGPTVATGAAIGSNLGRYFRMNYTQTILLLGCASCGAMAAIFKAPIAAIVFALEVIMLDLTLASLVPLLIASLTAALTSYLFLGQNVLYAFEIREPFHMNQIPLYIFLGILAGFISVYFTRMYVYITGMFEKIRGIYLKLLIGGLTLGFLIFLIPSLYGEGYEPINSCLNGNYSYLFENTLYERFSGSVIAIIIILFFIITFKVVATSVTFGSGGIGGIFAPSLFIGSNLGLFFAKLINLFGIDISESNFALVGMAGLIAGVIHAPLTAIFLIAEITGGYELFFPLMIVSTISFATVRVFTPNSVYTIQLAKRGELLTHDKDHNVLLLMKIDDLIETDFHPVSPDATLGDLVKVIKKAHRNIFPVVDRKGIFYGIVKMDDIRHIMFDPAMYQQTYVRDLMFMPQYTISIDEPMEEVAGKFQISNRYNIAVLDSGKYLGFVSRARVFSAYREMLKRISRE